jgi:ABC-type transport system substrate-binding protein
VVVIIVIVSTLGVLGVFSPKKSTEAFPLVYSSTKLTSTGQNISFSITNVTSSSVVNVSWNFGDNTYGYGSNVNHSYQYPGSYLVEVTYKASNGKTYNNDNTLFPITVTKAPSSLAAQETLPVILFNKTLNPSFPLYNTSSKVSAQAGYLEPPTASGWVISGYNWSFNGVKSTGQYFNFSASTNGLFAVVLNITTSDSSASHSNLYMQSIFVHSNSTAAGILKSKGAVLNPTTITDAEVVPGGPYTLDPQVDWETVGMEITRNVYQTLVAYNGTSTTSYIPVLATNIPTVANGEISSNDLNWTFHIRANATFANGKPVTVFDVYFSMVRELLFATGNPGTGGYTLAQAVLPGYTSNTPNYNSYANITKALTYDNATQTITFHLFQPVPYFLDLLSDTPSSVMEYSWAAQHGAGLAFTPSGFKAYMQEADASDYNSYIESNTMGSGPFTVSLVNPGESITLSPNPYYNPPAYGFPKSNYTVVVEYVKEASTAILLFNDGSADLLSALPTSSLPSVQTDVASGTANIYTFSTMTTYFYPFNFDINTTMLASMGTYTIPSHYFANIYVRKAFADAFNYSEFISSILGNSKYHLTLGTNYVGLLPPSMLGYKPFSSWMNVPQYNLTQAKKYLYLSGNESTVVNFPVYVQAGDTTNFAAMSMWASIIHAIDSNITMTPVYIPFSEMIGYTAANANPMPIYDLGWGTSIPDPINMIPPMYVAGGFYPAGDGIASVGAIQAMGHPHQAQNFSMIANLSNEAMVNSNVTQRSLEYQQANQIGINLTLYLYTYIPSGMWIYRSWLNGVQFEENPVVGGEVDTLFCYLSK